MPFTHSAFAECTEGDAADSRDHANARPPNLAAIPAAIVIVVPVCAAGLDDDVAAFDASKFAEAAA